MNLYDRLKAAICVVLGRADLESKLLFTVLTSEEVNTDELEVAIDEVEKGRN